MLAVFSFAAGNPAQPSFPSGSVWYTSFMHLGPQPTRNP